MVWLNVPLLVFSNKTGNVQSCPSKQPVLSPQTQLGMSPWACEKYLVLVTRNMVGNVFNCTNLL